MKILQRVTNSRAAPWLAMVNIVITLGLVLLLIRGTTQEVQTQTTTLETGHAKLAEKLDALAVTVDNLELFNEVELCLTYEQEVEREPFTLELLIACAKATEPPAKVELRLPDPSEFQSEGGKP